MSTLTTSQVSSIATSRNGFARSAFEARSKQRRAGKLGLETIPVDLIVIALTKPTRDPGCKPRHRNHDERRKRKRLGFRILASFKLKEENRASQKAKGKERERRREESGKVASREIGTVDPDFQFFFKPSGIPGGETFRSGGTRGSAPVFIPASFTFKVPEKKQEEHIPSSGETSKFTFRNILPVKPMVAPAIGYRSSALKSSYGPSPTADRCTNGRSHDWVPKGRMFKCSECQLFK